MAGRPAAAAKPNTPKNETENALATQAAGGTALAEVDDYGDYVDAGFDNTSTDDFSIPYLNILQGLSPQIETLDGAKPGMFHNTVTDDLYDGKSGIVVVVAMTTHEYVEWVPRNQGGGLVGKHALDSEVVTRARRNAESFNQLSTDAGNDLVETYSAYLIILTDDGPVTAVMSCSSTAIKPYKAMMTKANMVMIPSPRDPMRKVKPPLFAHRFRLRTEKRKNNAHEWYTFVPAFDSSDGAASGARLSPDSDEFRAAAALYEVIREGAFTTNNGGAEQSRQSNMAGDDDVPF